MTNRAILERCGKLKITDVEQTFLEGVFSDDDNYNVLNTRAREVVIDKKEDLFNVVLSDYRTLIRAGFDERIYDKLADAMKYVLNKNNWFKRPIKDSGGYFRCKKFDRICVVQHGACEPNLNLQPGMGNPDNASGCDPWRDFPPVYAEIWVTLGKYLGKIREIMNQITIQGLSTDNFDLTPLYESGVLMIIGDITPHLIRDHKFFEGKTRYRINPIKFIDWFNLKRFKVE